MEKVRIPYPSVVNDEGMYTHAKRVGEGLLGEEHVWLSPMIMAAEDFSFYGKRMQSALFNIGIKNESKGDAYPLHSPYFFVDEEVLPIGAAFHAAVAMAYLDSASLEV